MAETSKGQSIEGASMDLLRKLSYAFARHHYEHGQQETFGLDRDQWAHRFRSDFLGQAAVALKVIGDEGFERPFFQKPVTNIKQTDKMLNTKQAAKLLSLSPKTLENWRCSGSGPKFTKIGRLVMYNIGDLNRWIDARKHWNTSEYEERDHRAQAMDDLISGDADLIDK